MGADRGDDLVRAGDFVAFLQRLLAALGAVDRAINGHETKYFRLSGLSIGSAAGTLHERVGERFRARAFKLAAVEPAFGELLATVETRHVPTWSDSDVLVKLRDLAAPLNHVASTSITTRQSRVQLDENFRRDLEKIMGQDVTTVGEIVGTLDAVNMHDQLRAFLYPRRGEPRIPCDFPLGLREQVVGALNRRVRIVGELKRRENGERPYSIKIHRIEMLPDEAKLPLFEDLYGASISYPADIDPVLYVRELREAD